MKRQPHVDILFRIVEQMREMERKIQPETGAVVSA